MSKESNFLIYCMERYRHFKGLSRADVTKTFENTVSVGILQSILNRCIQWEIIALYRTLTIISAVLQAMVWERHNLADIPKGDEGL